jgi:hypothetical protein
MKMALFWDVAPCGLVVVYRRFRGACGVHHQALMMATAKASETPLNFHQTTRPNNPEDSHLRVLNLQNCIVCLERVLKDTRFLNWSCLQER